MNAPKARILVVDKAASQASLFKSYLDSRGYDVRCAYSGRDAIDIVERGHIDLVTLDEHVSGGSITDILDQLCAMSFQGHVLIITDHPRNPDAAARLQHIHQRALLLFRP